MLLGGSLAVVSLFSGVLFLASTLHIVAAEPAFQIASLAVYIASLLGTLWATGFWGRWGMLLFFAAAPMVVLLDAGVNPLFPAGSVCFAGMCYGIRRRPTPPRTD